MGGYVKRQGAVHTIPGAKFSLATDFVRIISNPPVILRDAEKPIPVLNVRARFHKHTGSHLSQKVGSH